MKADPAVQRQMLELAKVDAELSRTEHRRRTLPELAEITDVEKKLRDLRDSLVAVQTSASDLDREIARQEREIESVRAREDDAGVHPAGARPNGRSSRYRTRALNQPGPRPSYGRGADSREQAGPGVDVHPFATPR